MVGCQDCIHYEVCDYRDPARYETIQELKNDCRHCIPTADVVPRVELDAMRGAANSYKMHYEKAKQEADRLAVELEAEKTLRVVGIERIFEEIEKDGKYAISFVENHKSYSEEVRQAKLECYKDVQNYVAELKKKYTGGI